MLMYIFSHFRSFGLAFAGGFIVTAGCLFFILRAPNSLRATQQNNETEVLADSRETNPDVSVLDRKALGVLLFGYGGAGHDGGYLTDAIQVIYINFEKGKIAFISIPRDLWVNSPVGGDMKINNVLVANSNNKHELVESGAPALKKVISEITGLELDYFVGVDFVGFQRAIGLNLKGLEVNVAESLDDPWYPVKGKELELCGMSPEEIREVHAKYSGFELERQFACRYKHLHFEKGLVAMEGEQALEYVRSRHGSAEGDISRGKRQQEVLEALKKKLLTFDTLGQVPDLFRDAVQNITTDIDFQVIEYLLPVIRIKPELKLVKLNLTPGKMLSLAKSASGAFILVPKEGMHKWNAVHEYVASQLK